MKLHPCNAAAARAANKSRMSIKRCSQLEGGGRRGHKVKLGVIFAIKLRIIQTL